MNGNYNNYNNYNNDNLNYQNNFQQPQYNQNNMNYQQFNQNGLYPNNAQANQNKKDVLGIISIVLGVITILASFFVAFLALPIGIIGLILGIISKAKEKMAGIILNVIGMVISIVMTIVAVILILAAGELTGTISDTLNDTLSNDDNMVVFVGDGYTLEYNSDLWTEEELEDYDRKGLTYTDDKLYLVSYTRNSLSNIEDILDCSVEDNECKNLIYYSFYTDVLGDYSTDTFDYNKTNYFSILKDDIYYATIDYKMEDSYAKGTVYLMISKNNNVILTFITTQDVDDDTNYYSAVLDVLKSIDIDKYEDDSDNDNTDDEDDTDDENDDTIDGDMLDSLSNWNRFADLRKGSISHVNSINGGWRILDYSDTYWVFKDNEFWWYKSINDLTDNYYYGNVEVYTGKEGIKKAGLGENKVDNIISKSNGTITENDIYTLIITPKMLINKESDNGLNMIPNDLAWTNVWILVDHGSEGIEAQVLDLSTYSTAYYVKVND